LVLDERRGDELKSKDGAVTGITGQLAAAPHNYD
jgi:hypothetical protein